jgi:hypothetical protein
MHGLPFVHQAMAVPSIPQFLDELYQADIRPGLCGMAKKFDSIDEASALQWGDAAFADWMRRLRNPGMDFSNWFVCQNCTQKIALRFLPTVADVIACGGHASKLMAYCIAAIMRFLTPMSPPPPGTAEFVGGLKCRGVLERIETPQGYAMADGSMLEYTWKADVPGVLPVLAPLRQLALTHGHEVVFTNMVKDATKAFLELVPGVESAADYDVGGESLTGLVAQQYQTMLTGEEPIDVLGSVLHMEMALSPRHREKRSATISETQTTKQLKTGSEADVKQTGATLSPLRKADSESTAQNSTAQES